MRPRRRYQVLAGFGRAERGMRRQRHVGKLCQRMIGRQRLGIEDVEAGVADMARRSPFVFDRIHSFRISDPENLFAFYNSSKNATDN